MPQRFVVHLAHVTEGCVVYLAHLTPGFLVAFANLVAQGLRCRVQLAAELISQTGNFLSQTCDSLSDGRKFNPHLVAELHDLQLDTCHPRREGLKNPHVLLQKGHAFGQIRLGHP